MIAFPEPPDDQPPLPSPRDPTPDEIDRRAAKIRRGWSDKQRQRRRVFTLGSNWRPPLVFIADLSLEPPSEN